MVGSNKSPHPESTLTNTTPKMAVPRFEFCFVGNLLNNAALKALFIGIMKLINNLVILVSLIKILLVTVRRYLT
jgi:hypothetical protein